MIDEAKNKDKVFPCPHGRYPMNGQDGWKHCPYCLGLNDPVQEEISDEVSRVVEETEKEISKPPKKNRRF